MNSKTLQGIADAINQKEINQCQTDTIDRRWNDIMEVVYLYNNSDITASTVITIFTVFVKVTALRREYDFGKREIEKTVDQILEIFNI